MTTIKDLQTLKNHNAELQAAIAAAIAPFGLTLQRQSGTINTPSGELRLTLSTTFLPAGVEDAEELARTRWEKSAPLVGLPADAYGLTIRLGGKSFKLAGIDLKRRLKCVQLARVDDGKIFIASPDNVRVALTLKQA